MTENTTASGAADRVNAYLDRRATMRSIDPEVVHGIDGPDFELTVSDLRALAASAPVAPTPPDWRELCRRLYVELFHCDKQMTCSLNEDGKPIWRTGTEVRDVLSDAKAALEANPVAPQAAPVAPAPQPAPMPYPTDAQIDAVYEQTMGQHLRSQDTPAVRRFGRAMFLYAWNAAAPKAAPAINKVSTIIDAYGMTPGQPERVADIPGLAEALEAAFADGSAQVTGAAQAAPDVVEELIRERDHRDEIIDALCDAVLEDRPEWSSSYYFEDAVVAVQERIAELEARNECRDLNAQAAPAPASGEAVSPFGYFRAEPFGWTDCAESDEGAKPLYEKPQAHSDLHAAAQALVDRWDTPNWNAVEPTGQAIERLREALAAQAAQEARVPLTSEQQRCIAEAHNVAACEEYFNARPQIDYIANRRIFEAGFSKGYGITAAQKETPCAPTPSL